MSTLSREVRQAVRSLRRRPGLTLAAWLTLALGIGANTAIFSVVEGLLLRPLPYAASERLVLIWERQRGQPGPRLGGTSDATFLDWRHEARSFEALSALAARSMSLTSLDLPETLFTRAVTAGHLPLFGVEPILGRTFTPEEERAGARVVLLSHGVWQRFFAADPAVVGRTVELDGEPYEVIGVMPAPYYEPVEPAPVELWVPLHLEAAQLDRGRPRLLVYGRLAPGVSLATAQAEMARLAGELRRRHPETQEGLETEVRPVQEVLVGHLRTALWTLFAAGGFLLLIVCGNVAHLLLVRALGRRREMAVRTALGAARGQLLRQLMVESALLSLAGAATALGLAHLGLGLVKALVPVRLGLPRLDGVAVDAGALFFTLAVALVTALAFGLLPARTGLVRMDLSGELKAGDGRATGGGGGHRLRSLLVVSQIALALVLLVGTVLMLRTFVHLARRDPARDPSRVLTLRTSLRGPAYEAAESRVSFFRRAEEEIAALPGVVAVGVSDLIPLGVSLRPRRFTLEGAPVPAGEEPVAFVQIVSPGYLRALGAPQVRGRAFDDRDAAGAPPVAVVNRAFVAAHLAGGAAVGRRLALVGDGETREIVGVVGDLRAYGNHPDAVPTLFLPHAQQPAPIMTFFVRTGADPDAMSRSVRAAIARLDPLMATYGVASLAASQAQADWQPRFSAVLLGVLSGLALVLAVTGIYAVMAAGVAERGRELGIRAAFGARPGELLALVLGRGLRLALAGIACGLVGAALISRLVASQLYGVTATDPLTYAAVATALAVIALGASLLPALRAMRVDPAAALRRE